MVSEDNFVKVSGCYCRSCAEARKVGGPVRADAALAFEEELYRMIAAVAGSSGSAASIEAVALALVRGAHWRREAIRDLYDETESVKK